MKKRIMSMILLILGILSFTVNFKNNESYTNSMNIIREIMMKRAYDIKEPSFKLGEDIVDNLLENIDYSKMFFTKDELEELFEIKKDYAFLTTVSYMNNGFSIYNRYLENVSFYYDYAIELIKNNNFNFKEDEKIEFERNKREFANNVSELKEVWRKRVKNDFLRLKLDGKKDEEIINILIKRYKSNKDSILKLKENDASQIIISSFTESIDPHSLYYNPENTNDFLEDLSASLIGMGAVIERRGDVNIIKELIPGGPAEKIGLFDIGDVFISVGQGKDGEMEDVRNISVKELSRKIRGKKGSTVRIGITKGENGPFKIISIVREEINLEDKRIKTKIFDIDNKKVSYIKIPSFYVKTDDGKGFNVSEDFKDAINDANNKKVSSIVIDLRDNGGGSLSEVIKMIGYVIGRDKVAVQVSDINNKVIKSKTNTDKLTNLPIVVMINRYSASASEIFAGAIKDYNRGILVGSVSWGKGTVQNLSRLEKYGMIKLTTQMFFRANGSSTQILGVSPDIEFENYYSEEIGEKKYKNALKWRKVKDEVNDDFGAKENIETIREKHIKRIKNNNAWKIYMEEKEYRFNLSQKNEYTLNYEKRLEEREKNLKKREYFLKEFKKNKLSTVNIFEVDNGLSSNEENIQEALKKKKERENLVDEEMKEAFRISFDIK